ncbi:TraR/DksA family transcriptional regulator [Nocardioides pantholopis]|uniref:TraR/DksA family transcriptional regulator n=1 Tax=Nocardioides pantholopis TaxID=2483798 RepID=UPI000FD82146|nr:TraR/DksA C4-type zinc finger protein [Nocardioides pantholopis]
MARSKTTSPDDKSASAARDVNGKAAGAAPGSPARKAPDAKEPAPRKAAAKKTSASRGSRSESSAQHATVLVVKEGESAWTSTELAEVLAELQAQRGRSLTIVGEHEHELSGLMRDAGDGAGQDQADVGSTTFERDHELHVLTSERDKVAQIDRALGRIEDGTYGACETCDQAIGKMRLMAFPRATLCLTCKQREERR